MYPTEKNKLRVKCEKGNNESRPSTSRTSKAGVSIKLSQSSESCDDSEYVPESKEEDECCVSHTFQAGYIRKCEFVSFVSWGKCDLKYCPKARVFRRDSVFWCPHPLDEE